MEFFPTEPAAASESPRESTGPDSAPGVTHNRQHFQASHFPHTHPTARTRPRDPSAVNLLSRSTPICLCLSLCPLLVSRAQGKQVTIHWIITSYDAYTIPL